MKFTPYILAAALLPASVAAQDPVERLAELLPATVASEVIERIEAARARNLPVHAAASLALEGVAKGRSGAEVLTAVETLVGDMGRAQEALQNAGRTPLAGEVEAAAAAMRQGVDGDAISALARSEPSGRTLAVPLLALGSLTDRGLASDEALGVVRARLASRADDASLMAEAGARRSGERPDDVGLALAGALAGFQVPVAGVQVPVGPLEGSGRGPPPGRGPGS
jgi:hypothetical protein